jgi:gliding motility-associated-like protein
VDITQAGITAGSTAGLTYTYFANAAGTTALPNPSAIAVSGTYYIKGTSVGGCTDIKPVTVVINPLPIAGIVYSGGPFCATGTAAVTQTGQTGGTYSSSSGLALNPATGSVNLAASTPGTYTVTYSFSNGTCSNTASTTITVAPSPILLITNPAPVCAPATIDLTQAGITAGSSSGITLSYFTNAAGTTALTNPSAISVGGTYYIMATSAAGCKTIQPVTVVINALPVASISYAGPYCVAGTATVTQTGQGGGTYSAASGLSLNPATGAVNLAASTPGTYTVTYTFTNGTCGNTATASIAIAATPNLVVNNPAPVCAPSTVDLTAAAVTAGSDAGLSFAYFTDAAATNTLANPSAIGSSGTYFIQATSAAGCKTVRPVNVTINPLPVAAINYPNSPYCAAGAVTATVTQTGQAGGTYSAPGGLSINPATGAVNLAASTPGSYVVTYSFTNGVCTNTATTTIVIGATPVLTITNPAAVCAPATVNLTAAAVTAGSTAGLTYSYFADAAGTNPLANPSAIGTSGTYYIQGTTAGGCKTPIRPVIVVINPAPVASITYNGAPFCGTGTVPVSQTGQGGGTYSSSAGLTINPATGTINLGSSTPGTYTITYNFSNGTCNSSVTTTITIITSPVLTTHNPAPVCAPASVDLTAAAVTAGSTAGLTFTYFTNAAGTVTLANPGAVTVSGTYYIQGTSASGCITTIVPVTVTIVPVPVASISYPGSPYCQAATSSATVAQSGQGGGTYSSTAGLTINPATGAINIAASTPGTYAVTYSFSNGTCTNTTTTLLTIESNPVLVIHNPAAVCAPASADITAASITAGSTPGLSFAYFTNAAGTTSLANPSAITSSGTYYIQGTSASGCKTSVQAVTVTINPLPVASIAYTGSPYCATGSAMVTQTGQGGGTYTAPAGLIINPTTGEVDPGASTSGTYTITYTFSNGSCSNTATASLTIAPKPVLTITSPAPVCSPATVDITAAAVTAGSTPGLALAYFNDAAATVPLANANAITTSGTYYIQGTTAGGCRVISAVQVTINARAVAAISYAGTPFCTAGTAAVTQTGQTGGTYSAAAGLSINPATGAINITASTAGTYTVTYSFSNGTCGNTATTTVVIATVPVLVITNPAPVCAPVAVDLTASAITAGSTAGLNYAYFTDAAGTTNLTNPGAVTVSGTYYIQGTTPAGCKSPVRPVTVVINPIPVASISYAGSPFCAAQTAAATVTQTGQAGGTYSAAAGLSINPSTGAINIVGSTAGTYTVTYSFTNGTCSNATTTTVRIDPLPVIVVTNPAAACAPGTVDITASTVTAGSTPGLTYNYYIDPAGLVNLSKPEAINTSGTYYVQGVSPSGCVTGIEAVNVVINLLPVASISYNSSPFCVNAGGTGIVTQTGTGGGTYTSSPAGLSINASTGAINIAASTPGAYTVTYSFNNGLCSNTAKTTVSIMPVPVLLVTNPAPACTPGAVDITAASVTAGSTPGLTFQYYEDAACTTPLSSASAITTGGTYYIRGVYAATGCVTDVKPVEVIINSSPALTVAGASIVCKGEAVTITASSPGNTITWQNMNGGNSVIVYPQATTTYTAVATNAAGCFATATVQIQVRNFDVSLTANTNPIMPGTTLTLTSGATSSYTVVGWKPETLFPAQSAFAQSFLIKDSSQTFTVIGRSADGCLDTASLRVELEPGDKDFFIPNAFTPNNDGKNDVFRLYGSSIKSVELRVFNQWGELVYETKDKTKGWDGTFKGRAQPVGVYPFGAKVTFLDGTVVTKRGTVNLVR